RRRNARTAARSTRDGRPARDRDLERAYDGARRTHGSAGRHLPAQAVPAGTAARHPHRRDRSKEMSATLEQTLCSAAIYTFERMVFLLPDIPPDEMQRRQNVQAVATIAFSGPARGRLQVHAGEGLLPRLTANMMGMDVAPVAMKLEAIGVIANDICGQ